MNGVFTLRCAEADAVYDFPLAHQVRELRLNTLRRSSSGLYGSIRRRMSGVSAERELPERNAGESEGKLERNYFEPAVRWGLSRQAAPEYRGEALGLWQIWCEGTFAAQKWGYILTRVLQ